MKLKLLLAYTANTSYKKNKYMFYMMSNYTRGAILRFRNLPGNLGFYVGRKDHSLFNDLNAYLKKL